MSIELLQPEAGDNRQRDIEVRMLDEKMRESIPHDGMPELERMTGREEITESPRTVGRSAMSGFATSLPGYYLG